MSSMNRFWLTLVGSLAAALVLVNWQDHFVLLERWHASVPGVWALLTLAGWLVRVLWLRVPGELAAGFFLALVVRQAVYPMLPQEPQDHEALRMAWAAGLQVLLTLGAHASLEPVRDWFDRRGLFTAPLRQGLLALAVAVVFGSGRGDLLAPYGAVLGIALLASLLRIRFLKQPGRFLTVAAWCFGAWFVAQDGSTGDGDRSIELGMSLLAPAWIAVLAVLWETLAARATLWTLVLAVVAILPNLLGSTGLHPVSVGAMAVAVAWWSWRLWGRLSNEKGAGLPLWLADLAQPLARVLGLILVLGLLALSRDLRDPGRVAPALSFFERNALQILALYFVYLRSRAWGLRPEWVKSLGAACIAWGLVQGLWPNAVETWALAALLGALFIWRLEHPVSLGQGWVSSLTRPWGRSAALTMALALLSAFDLTGSLQGLLRVLLIAALLRHAMFREPLALRLGAAWLWVQAGLLPLLGAWLTYPHFERGAWGLLAPMMVYALWERATRWRWVVGMLALALLLPWVARFFESGTVALAWPVLAGQVIALGVALALRALVLKALRLQSGKSWQDWRARALGRLASASSATRKRLPSADPAAAWARIRQDPKRALRVGLGALAVVALMAAWSWWRDSSALVESFSPQGLVASPSTVIQARFTHPVQAQAEDLEGSFLIEPPLQGSTRLADERTLVFQPSEALAPSTEYRARLSTHKLSTLAFRLQGSAETRFHTERFTVKNLRLYYNYDLLRLNETELVGEVDFSQAVSEAGFKEALSVSREGQAQGFTVEKGLLPGRFIFKVGGLKRLEQSQSYQIRIDAALTCEGCGLGLAQAYQTGIELPAKPRFELQGIQLHYQAGRSLVAVQFNLPITQAEAEANIKVQRLSDKDVGTPIAIKIESEYAYAVLSADFMPNTRYRVTVSERMRSKDGRLIVAGTRKDKDGQEKRQDHAQVVHIQDAPTRLRFQDGGHYLPRRGSGRVSVLTTNLDDFQVTGFRVFKNNLVHHLRDNGPGGGDDGRYGRAVFDRTVQVQGGEINQEVPTQLDLPELLGKDIEGLFNVVLRNSRRGHWERNWYLATDIGLSATRAGQDLWVQALSVSALEPMSGVLLELYSHENQVLRSARTDAQGRARFEGVNAEVKGMRPFVLVASQGEDLSFLQLDRNPLSASRFDTGGDPVSEGGFEAFLSTDRGLYRPGDQLHVTGILRRHDLSRADQPVRLRVRDPQWNKVFEQDLQPDSEGMLSHSMPLRAELMTGDYQADLMLKGRDEVLVSSAFKIEEFIPNKIKAEVELAAREAAAGGRIEYTVRAQHLFGAPASGLAVKSVVSLGPARFEHPDYGGYRFSDDSRHFSGQVLHVPNGFSDGQGGYPVSLDIPTSVLPASMMEGNVYAEVMDDGGRPVGANALVRIHRYPYYLGLKAKDGLQADPGQTIGLSLVAVDPAGKRIKAAKVPVIVARRRWYSLFQRHGWRGAYQSSFYDEVVEAKAVNVDGEATVSFKADLDGEYTVTVGEESGMRSSIKVLVRGKAAQDNSAVSGDLQDPGALGLRLDKNVYLPGESAKVTVQAPFAGRLLLSVERETVFEQRSVMVPAGRSEHFLAVGQRLNPNAYVVGLLVRKPSEELRELPVVSFGVAPLQMDLRPQRLSLAWTAPATVGSKDGLDVDLLAGEPGAKVVLAAVDEGILQIINFSTPDPFARFYRKRRLQTQLHTFFDEVLPDLQRRESVGGDSDEDFERRHLNPVAAKRVRSFAVYSGILTADSEGRIRHRFETGDFQGEARVMAMAVRGSRFGSRAFKVKVADDLVLQPHLPRFLAPGDLTQMPVRVFNQTDATQVVRLSVAVEGPIRLQGRSELELKLEPQAQASVDFDLTAQMDAGVAVVKVQGRLADGRAFDKRIELAVRPGQPLTTELRQGRLGPGHAVGLDIPGDFIPHGRKARVLVSANPLYEFIGAFSYLVRYPYGCAEQVCSQAFSMLALKGSGLLGGAFNLASGSGGEADAQRHIQAGVRLLQKLQNDSGTFRMWAGSEADAGYLSDYVSHFLLEAHRAGVPVEGAVLDRIRRRLGAIHIPKNTGRLDRSEHNIAERSILDAYRLYLRALAGHADREAMRAMLDDKALLEGLPVFDRALLALAFAETGDNASARKALPPLTTALGARVYRESGGRWSSSQRDLAGYLMALARSGGAIGELEALIDELRRRMKDGHFGSTQDNAWTFMALTQAIKRLEAEKPMRAEWRVGEGLARELTVERALLGDKDGLFGKRLSVANKGEGRLAYFLIAEGTRITATAGAVSQGMSVKRSYRDEKGAELKLGNVTQGQLVVVTLEVECKQPTENLVIVDLLPAGFEVDNPRLQSRGRLGFTPPYSIDTASMDFRDDRVLLFTTGAQRRLQFSYSVRAVTPGTYRVPALLAEAMYDPEIYGRSDPGTELVVAPNRF